MPELSVARVQAAVLLGRGAYLHASAVLRRDGEAILVTGSSGSGKSTLAILMHRSGFPALADDTVAAFRNSRGRILVQPSLGDCLWASSREPVPLGGIVFIEKGRGFQCSCLDNVYAYYRLLRDGGLWSDVYRLYKSSSEYVQSRRHLRRIIEDTPCVLISYAHGNQRCSRLAVEFLSNGF
jgi:energy-coupling factor transporter ATP-binding protein EcfA2